MCSNTKCLRRFFALALPLAAALVLAAGCGDSNQEQAKSPPQETLLVCQNDGHSFTLTPAEFSAQSSSARDPDMMRGQTPRVRCPKCSQLSAIQGIRCPKDQTPMPSVTTDGQRPKCPKCGWTESPAR